MSDKKEKHPFDDIISGITLHFIGAHAYRWSEQTYRDWYEYSKLAKNLPEELRDTSSFEAWFKPELFAEFTYYKNFDSEALQEWIEHGFGQAFADIKDTPFDILEENPVTSLLLINHNHSFHDILYNLYQYLVLKVAQGHVKIETTSTAKYPSSAKAGKNVNKTAQEKRRQIYQMHKNSTDWFDIAIQLKYFSEDYSKKYKPPKILTEKEIYEYHTSITNKTRKKTDFIGKNNEPCYDHAIDLAKRWVNDNYKRAVAIIKNVENGTYP